MKPPKFKGDVNNNVNCNGTYEERLEKVRPTASRHLIFIRHGQYNLEGPSDTERHLTELGKWTNSFYCTVTGERINFLSDRKYFKVLMSSDVRM